MNDKKSPSIEIMQDLHLHCSPDQETYLRDALDRHSTPPWRHATEKEQELAESSSDMPQYLMFERTREDHLAAAAVALCKSSAGFKVVNIIPLEVHHLGVTAYNDLLNDFIDRVVVPASKELQFDFPCTERRQTLTDWISADAATALHRFSLAANKSTGAGHPSDRQRWFEFLTAVYDYHAKLDSELLGRWLVEVEDWPPEMAHDLVDKYQYSMDFLRFRTNCI